VKQLGSHVFSRNDEISEWLDECDISLDDLDTDGIQMQGDPVRVRLRDSTAVSQTSGQMKSACVNGHSQVLGRRINAESESATVRIALVQLAS
jgi:hypothetical protein